MTVYDDAQMQLKAAGAAVANLSATVDKSSELAPMEVSVGAALSSLVEAQNALTKLQLMPLVSGLFVEGMHSPAPQVKNLVCNVKWSDLQSTSKGGLIHPNPIDNFLSKNVPGHVRLYFGRFSPKFAFAHGSVTMTDPQSGLSEPIPYWWNNQLQVEQADCISKLAAAYDGQISLIFMATPMTMFAEPMQRGGNRDKAMAAGCTEAVDRSCFTSMLDMFSVFQKTRLGLSFNPKQTMDGKQDVTWTNAFMDTFRDEFGDQAHVQNNSVRTPTLGGQMSTLYDHMKGMHPSGYQLATVDRVGDYAKSVQWCISQGAHSVELSPMFQDHLTAAQLTALDAALRQNGAS